jgi:hypothetical protein
MSIADIIHDDTLSEEERANRVAAELRALPRDGVEEATSFVRSAQDSDEAYLACNYLGLLPDLELEKQALLEFVLRERRDLLEGSTLLVRSVPERTVDAVLELYAAEPEQAGAYDVAYEAALFFPARARGVRSLVDDETLLDAMLPGDDESVDALVAAYRDDPDPRTLRRLSRIRTEGALSALIGLRAQATERDQELLDLCLEAAGYFSDTRRASTFEPTYRGFVVPRGRAPHHIGRGFDGRVPQCPICETPATRVLTVDAGSVPDFSLARSPSFFWWSCEHKPLDYLYVAFTDDGTEGLMVELTDREPEDPIVPDDAGLALELHANQFGYGLDITPGYGLHQTGGYTPWIELDHHPRCARCGNGMQFLASLDSGLTMLGTMGFKGMLYGFWCDTCSVSCTTQQTDELDELL